MTASNSGGGATESFKLSVVAAPPAVVTAPNAHRLRQDRDGGQRRAGTWSGKPAPTIALQWRRDGAAIAGATAASYVLQAADAGHQVSVLVTARNTAGSVSVSSNSLAIGLAAHRRQHRGSDHSEPARRRTLTATSDGHLDRHPTPTFARNWQRKGTDIAGRPARPTCCRPPM